MSDTAQRAELALAEKANACHLYMSPRQRIANILKHEGLEEGPLDPLELQKIDSMHYEGTAGVERFISGCKVGASTRVLDVGAGFGGSSRYVAHKTGAHVTSLELVPEISAVSARLTARCGLQGTVSGVCGNMAEADALRLEEEREGGGGAAAPLVRPGSFDALLSQLVFLHVPAKQRAQLWSNCFAALKPGGTFYFEDLFARRPFDDAGCRMLADVIGVPAGNLPTRELYERQLRDAGFEQVEFVDRSEVWAPWCAERVRGYGEARATHEAIHGAQIVRNMLQFYDVVGQLFGETTGSLGGCVVTGRKQTRPRAHSWSSLWPMAIAVGRSREIEAGSVPALCTDRSAALRPQWLSSARARSPELGAAGGHGSNKGLTGRSVQEGTAVEVQWPSGARAMGYSFIGSYQSASGALP